MNVQIFDNSFPSLSQFKELREELMENMTVHSFEKGQVILREGQFIKVIPLLIKGLIKVYKEDESEGEVLLYYIKGGESCVMSMTALLKNEKSKVKGVVEETAEIIVVSASDAQRIAKKYPEWNAFFYNLFSSKYDELLNVITTLTFSTKDLRLFNYLKTQVELKDDPIVKKTHQEIALDLGSSREVISRILKKLETEGKVELLHGKIKVN